MPLPKSMFEHIDGIRTPRPKKQDIQPKAFKGKPAPFVMICFSEPTDRYILWFLKHYPYGFNGFFVSDLIAWNPGQANNPNSALSKYLKHIKTLNDRGLIKQNWNRTEWRITWKGQIHRIYTHSTFNFWILVLGLLIGVLATFKDEIFNGKKNKEPQPNNNKERTIKTPDYSALDSPAQIEPLKVKDSSVSQIDTTKTKPK